MIVARHLIALLVLAITTAAHAQEPGKAAPDVCNFIAGHQADMNWPTNLPGDYGARRSSFFNDYMVRFGWLDLDGDGIGEEVKQSEINGTMGGDAPMYTLSSAGTGREPGSGFSLLPKDVGDYLETKRFTFGEGFLPFRGRIYDVTFEDERGAFPVDVSYFLQGGGSRYACIFRNRVEISYWNGANYMPRWKADVAAVAPRPGVTALAGKVLEAAGRLPKNASALRHSRPILGGMMFPHCSQHDADCKDVWNVDFDNDGKAERLLRLYGASGAGRGWGGSYFVLLTPTGDVAKGSKQDLLLKLQNVDLEDVYPIRPAGMEFRWLDFGGRIVLQRRSENQPATNTLELVDDLWIARKGETTRLAYASFKVTPEIIYNAAPK
jgi:hypothetical protein